MLLKPIATLAVITAAVAVVLSISLGVPYIFTFVGASVLFLGGHLVTIDDDLPGGWSSPDGSEPFPWGELLGKIAIVLLLGGVAIMSPAIRSLGAG